MKENEWISIFDSLPNIGEEVEEMSVTDCVKSSPRKVKLKVLSDYIVWDTGYGYSSGTTHWRPIKEKRPDFSKLRDGDIIVLEYITHKKDVNRIYPIKVHSMNERVIFSETSGNFLFTGIKKITRINLEEQKFEEI